MIGNKCAQSLALMEEEYSEDIAIERSELMEWERNMGGWVKSSSALDFVMIDVYK